MQYIVFISISIVYFILSKCHHMLRIGVTLFLFANVILLRIVHNHCIASITVSLSVCLSVCLSVYLSFFLFLLSLYLFSNIQVCKSCCFVKVLTLYQRARYKANLINKCDNILSLLIKFSFMNAVYLHRGGDKMTSMFQIK